MGMCFMAMEPSSHAFLLWCVSHGRLVRVIPALQSDFPENNPGAEHSCCDDDIIGKGSPSASNCYFNLFMLFGNMNT